MQKTLIFKKLPIFKKCSIFTKMAHLKKCPIFTGPDLKRARRTGLSARRARRTKSSRPEGPKAGPKGRYLEVGARRAPRLLLRYISDQNVQQPRKVFYSRNQIEMGLQGPENQEVSRRLRLCRLAKHFLN